MKLAAFGPEAVGSLIPVSGIRGIRHAFCPDPLPPDWAFPAHLWPLLTKARVALADLNGVGKYLPNPDLILRPLQNPEAQKSSSLEGTYTETEEQMYPTARSDLKRLERAEIVSLLRDAPQLTYASHPILTTIYGDWWSERPGRLARRHVVPQPIREGGLVELAAGEGESEEHDFLFTGLDSEPVQAEKEVHGLECDALVSVHEGVVLRETEPVGRGQGGQICVGIVLVPVLRPPERRLQEPAVAQTERTSVVLNLVGVDGEHIDRQ